MRPAAFTATLVIAILLSARANAQTGVFADDFETGNTFAWSARVGEIYAPADAFRFSDLDLRDPHVLVDLGPPFFCRDVTDDFPLLPYAFNELLQASIETDSDLDGFLDASFLAGFRPYDGAASGLRLDFGLALCTAPVESTDCALVSVNPPSTFLYEGVPSGGVCLDVVPGTSNGYLPAIEIPGAPCFLAAARDMTLPLFGMNIPLSDLQFSAHSLGDPPTEFDAGLLRGFLAEADADAIFFPPTFPVVGGQPLSSLFPGGAANCSPTDDRDFHDGVWGWWLYFNFPAARVPFTEP